LYKRNPIPKLALNIYLHALLGGVTCALMAAVMIMISASLFIDILFQVLSLCIFCSIVYSTAWRVGDKDAVAWEFDRMPKEDYNIRKGLYAGLIA